MHFKSTLRLMQNVLSANCLNKGFIFTDLILSAVSNHGFYRQPCFTAGISYSSLMYWHETILEFISAPKCHVLRYIGNKILQSVFDPAHSDTVCGIFTKVIPRYPFNQSDKTDIRSYQVINYYLICVAKCIKEKKLTIYETLRWNYYLMRFNKYIKDTKLSRCLHIIPIFAIVVSGRYSLFSTQLLCVYFSPIIT